MTDRTLFASTAVLAVLSASGCAGTSRDATFPEDMPTMMQTYDGHFSRANTAPEQLRDVRAALAPGALPRGVAALDGYTRDAVTEVEQLFPSLPNPVIPVYVDPHLTVAGHPVPGYTTYITLYDTPQPALPGEVAP